MKILTHVEEVPDMTGMMTQETDMTAVLDKIRESDVKRVANQATYRLKIGKRIPCSYHMK